MTNESDREIVEEVRKSKHREVKLKVESYAFYNLGLLGNRAMIWQSLEEIDKSGWKGEVCVRSTKGIRRGKTRYNIPRSDLENVIKELGKDGIPADSLTFNQAMSDGNLTIQGEVMRNHQGLFLLYSRVKKPMNLALREHEERATGLTAKCLLESELWTSSYDDVMELLGYFSTSTAEPSAIVEFSAYNEEVGALRGRNTVIWEVRNY